MKVHQWQQKTLLRVEFFFEQGTLQGLPFADMGDGQFVSICSFNLQLVGCPLVP